MFNKEKLKIFQVEATFEKLFDHKPKNTLVLQQSMKKTIKNRIYCKTPQKEIS